MSILHELHDAFHSLSWSGVRRARLLWPAAVLWPALWLVLGLWLPAAFCVPVGLVGGAALAVWAWLSVFRPAETLYALGRRWQECLVTLETYHPELGRSLANMKEGNFTEAVQAPAVSAGQIPEYEELFRTIRDAADKIKLINMQNQRISVDLVRSIRALVEAGNIQASGSAEQASSVAEITATIEELARTAAQIAENSNKVAKLAENSDRASQEGFDLINTVIHSIEQIDDKMHQISQKTQVLSQQSKQIGKVLEIIYNIANETHLLALNAAIESVAAGEFGKRFGVVAAEVRRLAEISRENAESIKGIIEQFQNSIDTTSGAIEEGTKMSSTVNQTAQEIIKHLNKIVQAVNVTSQSANEISIATQQQRSASDQIVLTLKDVSQVTKQQAHELKKSSKELEKLNSLALNLHIATQQTVVDSPLSLGFKVMRFAALPEIQAFDRRLQQQVLARIVEENPFIEFIYTAGADGKLFALQLGKQGGEIPEAVHVGADCAGRPWYVNSIHTRHPYISEVYKSLLSSEDCFSVSQAIYGADGRLLGVFGMDINAREWNKIAQ